MPVRQQLAATDDPRERTRLHRWYPTASGCSGTASAPYVQAGFVQGHDERKGPLCFRLGGRSWQVVEIDWSRGTMSVKPAPAAQVPNWLGAPGVLSLALCQAMRDTLLDVDQVA